jgi:hypothetical protein
MLWCIHGKKQLSVDVFYEKKKQDKLTMLQLFTYKLNLMSVLFVAACFIP